MSAERSFFNFTFNDENRNSVNLHNFQNKDVIAVINCRTIDEIEKKAPLYYNVEDKFEKRVQILCVPGSKFLYHSHEQESKTLIDYLKEKVNMHDSDEDGMTFLVINKQHSPRNEEIIYVGRNVSELELTGEISKALN